MIMRYFSLPVLLLALLAFQFIGTSHIQDHPEKNFDKQWTKVNSLENAGQPKAALKLVEKILTDAATLKADANVIKAIIYKMKLTSEFEEEVYEKNIKFAESYIDKATFPNSAILHSIVAEMYWRYLSQNRYKIQNRSVVDAEMNEDFNTWDEKKFAQKIIEHYQASLKNPGKLVLIGIGKYQPILKLGDNSKIYRPTLLDFLAYRALDFYQTGSWGFSKSVNGFVLNQPQLFGPDFVFTSYNFSSADSLSLKLQAVKTYQLLLKFRMKSKNMDALYEADLNRIQFAYQNAVTGKNDSLYLKYLNTELEKNKNFPLSTRLVGKLSDYYISVAARYNFSDTNTTKYRFYYVKALQLCKKYVEKFPKSPFTAHLQNNIITIKKASLSTEFERVIPINQPFFVKLNYKNTNRVYGKIVSISKADLEDITAKNLYGEKYFNALMRKTKPVVPTTSYQLKLPKDFQSHSTELIFDKLPHGIYILLFSNDKHFKYDSTFTTYGIFTVSNLSFITRTVNHSYQELFVLNRITGNPVPQATVKIWKSKYNYKKRRYTKVLLGTYISDNQGYVQFKNHNSSDYESFYVDIETNDDYLPDLNNNYYLDTYRKKNHINYTVHFFTDRAVYRPGQTVHFKIIGTKHFGKTVDLAEAGKLYEIKLIDANRQTINTLSVKLNEFGSASGSFILPKDALNGRFTLQTDGGSTNISVEEYKRPKFFVKTNPVKGNFVLNDTVTVTGKAVSYAGAGLSEMAVAYSVVRTPVWAYRYYSWLKQQEVVISNGKVTTDAQGNFKIKFKAVPDLGYPKNNHVSFNYRVQIDVTDLNGETQSTSTYATAAYTAMNLSASVPQIVDKNDFDTLTVTSVNWNGSPVAATGKIEIFRLANPEKNFVSRRWTASDLPFYTEKEWRNKIKDFRYLKDWSINNAKVGKPVLVKSFDTGKNKFYNLQKDFKKLSPGAYMIKLTSRDTFNNPITYKSRFQVFDSKAKTPGYAVNEWHFLQDGNLKPGEKINYFVAATPKRQFLFEVEQDNQIIHREWISIDNQQKDIQFPILDKYRGNISIHLTSVYANRIFTDNQLISVPFDNKKLTISFATFRNKLLPGEKETWKVKISGYGKEKVAAEMLATMYDKSLDAIRPQSWYFNVFTYDYSELKWSYSGFSSGKSQRLRKQYAVFVQEPSLKFDQLNWFGYNSYLYGTYYIDGVKLRSTRGSRAGGTTAFVEDEPSPVSTRTLGNTRTLEKEIDKQQTRIPNSQDKKEITAQENKEEKVQIRKNFNETAFFYPDLRTDENGDISFTFTIPEALTTWKFMGFAHTKDLSYGQIIKEVVTQKPLMILSNPPRFFREGDKIVFPATVSNLDKGALSISVSLKLFDALTNQPISFDGKPQQIIVKPNESKSVSWEVKIPVGVQAITYRLVAKSQSFSDGEEDTKPVLSNRTMVTETMPMYINKPGTKQYQFTHLLNAKKSKTISSYHVAVEFTSNPVWYAIQALPYLMEYPDECSEQLFSRFYANNFASYLVNSQPVIKEVFDKWKNLPDSKTFLSNLEKNEDLKNIVLNQTPWVQDAANETEQKQRMGVLFDLNKMRYEKGKAMEKLLQMQAPNGGWPWFQGMPDSHYITQYIVEGLGEMQKYGIIDIKSDNKLFYAVKKAVQYLDNRNREDYKDLIKYKADLSKDHLYSTNIHYLYVRSLWSYLPLQKNNKTAYDYYYEQSQKFWVKKGLYEQGLIGFTLWNTGKKDITAKIIASLKDRSLHSDEFGNYWKQSNFGNYWYNSDIETQSLMIQLFQEATQDKDFVDNLKIWLLKQKQTRRWKSTKATVAAVNALISAGSNWLANNETVELKVGKFAIKNAKIIHKQSNLIAVTPEPGSGYFKVNWNKETITPDMGNVTVTKKQDGVAWGAMYWQYFDDIDKVIPAQAGLSVTRKLFKVIKKADGEVLVPAGEKTLKIGDKIIVRMILKTDRNLEYVHLRDLRASALEPIRQVSGYHYREGLGYYQSIKDASADFFIDYMPKGTYVFEYPLRVTYAGNFSNGFAMMQCLYAPEFAAHSAGQRITVSQ